MSNRLFHSLLISAAFFGASSLEAKEAPAPQNAPTSLVSFGKLNAGLTLGYGRAQVTEDDVLSSSLLEPLISNILSTNKRSGGFAWRLFGNLLFEVTPKVYMGPEIGFVHYPRSQYSQGIAFAFGNGGLNALYKVTSSSYGVDGLLNLTFFVVPEFMLSLRPGFQFAYQKNKISSSLDAAISGNAFSFPTKPSYRNTEFLPEIILSAAWAFFESRKHGWKGCDIAFTAELTYQHVFGHDNAPVNTRLNSRDLFGITFGVMF